MFGGTYVLLFMTDLRPPFYGASYSGALGVATAWPILVVWLVLLAGLFAATVIDARYYIIPLEIPWFISAVALVVLPAGVYLSSGLVPIDLTPGGWDAEGVVPASNIFGYEPLLPLVGHVGALVAFGGAVGLGLALVLRRLGVVPDSFEGEDDFDIETEPPVEETGPGLGTLQRFVVWLAPAGFVLGIGLNAYLQVGGGKLPGQLHVVAGGIVGYLAVRLLVLGLQLSVLKGDATPDAEDMGDEAEDVPPLKHPRLVVLKESFFVGFPLLGMLVGYYLARHVWTEPISEARWYGTLGGVVLGFLVGGGVIWAIRILGTFAFGKEAMGMGDIHLLAAIGAVIGWWESVFLCIFVAPFLGLAVVLMTLDMAGVVKKPSRQIPYGPYLAGAAVLILLLGMERVDLFGILQSFQPQATGAGHGPAAPLFVP
ncbi:MAG: A24 family peptidase [Planctomycetota bacterium]